MERLSHQGSVAGERLGIGWLTYHPLVLWDYHRLAREDAPGVVSALREAFPSARRWVDVGAGSGAFAAEAARRGVSVQACEWSRSGRVYARAQRVRSVPLDLCRARPASAYPADLALCFEVAEHLSPALGERLVEFLSQLAPVVAFTAAQPGQGGLGHVNEQWTEYWQERFATRGMQTDAAAGKSLRARLADRGVRAPWFRENLLVLVRP